MVVRTRLPILRLLVIVIVGVLLFWLGFGTQITYTLQARKIGRKNPFAWATPRKLPDLSVSESSGTTLEFFGYRFDVPWTDIDKDQTKIIDDNKAIIVFKSGNALSFWWSTPNGLIS